MNNNIANENEKQQKMKCKNIANENKKQQKYSEWKWKTAMKMKMKNNKNIANENEKQQKKNCFVYHWSLSILIRKQVTQRLKNTRYR